MDVFESYYERASEAVISSGGNMCSLDDFTDNYYTYDTNIYEYTEAVIENDGQSEDLSIMPLSSGSSEDAPYVLKYDKDNAENNRAIYRNIANGGSDYAVTPQSAFYRGKNEQNKPKYYEPTYSIFNYGNICEGDILIETQTVINDIGHTACIYDLDHGSYYGNYIQTIDCVGSGVQFGVLDDTRMVNYRVIVARHRYATYDSLEQVKYFHYKQLGKEYDLFAAGVYNRLNLDINSTSWYCSELMYAAYNYAGIPFSPPPVKVNNNKIGWWPEDIRNSPSVRRLMNSDTAYLEISIADKPEWNMWSINVTNNTNQDVVVEYNTKMCNYEDAEKWVGLNDIVSVTIYKNSTKALKVQENWFASCVAFSKKLELSDNNTKRLITFADQLDKDKKTLRVRHAMVNA